tara:strand:- start:1280 stop:1480 length:201 start_codon:yes stop_codon:yes gene_type:complete
MTFDLIIILGVLLLALVIFFLPTVIAFGKGHKYCWIILFINVVFGFTLIGWFGALIWSVAGDDDIV